MLSKRVIYLFIIGLLLSNSVSAQTRVIAHRGFWDTDGSAQNSLASLNRANEIGVYGSEFDVWMTRDGVPVINHDETIQNFRIEDADYKQIKNIRLKNGEKLPTLKQYLKTGKKNKNIRLVLEIKSHRTPEAEARVTKAVVEAVRKMKLEKQVDYISFSMFICKELHRLAPEAPVAYLNGDASPAEIKQAGFTGLDYNVKVFTDHPEWIKEAQQLGLTVNVWTVNDKNQMKHFTDSGVDFITTDKPLELKKMLLK